MNAIVNASHLAIALFALWFLYSYCWRDHRNDTFRQHIFAVRGGLFAYAVAGAIRLDDPAYTTLRDLSGGLIRVAHRLTFTRVWIVAFFGGLSPTNRMQVWLADVQTRPLEVRERLLKAHAEMMKAALWHVLAWSPLAWICVPATLAINLIRVRAKISAVRAPREISTLLEQQALDQSSLIDDVSLVGA